MGWAIHSPRTSCLLSELLCIGNLRPTLTPQLPELRAAIRFLLLKTPMPPRSKVLHQGLHFHPAVIWQGGTPNK